MLLISPRVYKQYTDEIVAVAYSHSFLFIKHNKTVFVYVFEYAILAVKPSL